MKRLIATVIVSLVAAGSGLAATPALYKNCTNLTKKYPNGISRAKQPKLYKLAMSYNKRLDGDKDGVACER